MFDKMIVSSEDGAESKGRGRYFLVTSGIVAILFSTAVVLSIYAVDLNLGSDNLELSMMLAPVVPTEPDEPARPEPERNQTTQQRSETPTRVVNMPRPDEVPLTVPDRTSVTPNRYMARPTGRFDVGPSDTPGSGRPSDNGTGRGNVGSEPSGSSGESQPVAETVKIPDPPPAIKPKPRPMLSKGVITGRATSLPTPPYPAPARMVGAQGGVSVQVIIDETGKVISAKAIDGHPLLRPAAEKAAWGAKFDPTKLSDVPVKVTGVIVYNFKRS